MKEVKRFIGAEVFGHSVVVYAHDYDALLAERNELKQKYHWLQKVTPYKFKKMQDASITDGGDVLYFHENRFDIEVHAAIAKARGDV
jgi:hypothetical protein